MVYSISVGGIFALVFAYCVGRVGRLQPRALAGVIALIAFCAVALIPGLKYPANPPAVGDPATIALRTQMFFLMILVSVAAAITAINIARRVMRRGGGWQGALVGIGLYLLIMTVTGSCFPSFNEAPASFPSALLWDFRMAFLGIHAVLWAALALVFSVLVNRPHSASRQYSPL